MLFRATRMPSSSNARSFSLLSPSSSPRPFETTFSIKEIVPILLAKATIAVTSPVEIRSREFRLRAKRRLYEEKEYHRSVEIIIQMKNTIHVVGKSLEQRGAAMFLAPKSKNLVTQRAHEKLARISEANQRIVALAN